VTTNERIAKLEEKKKQIEAQRRQLIVRRNKKERAVKTHRLVEIGAICEEVLGKPIEKEDLPKLRVFLEQHEVFEKLSSLEKNITAQIEQQQCCKKIYKVQIQARGKKSCHLK